MPPTITQSNLHQALAILPLQVTKGTLSIDLKALLASPAGQSAALDLAQGWIRQGAWYSAAELLDAIDAGLPEIQKL